MAEFFSYSQRDCMGVFRMDGLYSLVSLILRSQKDLNPGPLIDSFLDGHPDFLINQHRVRHLLAQPGTPGAKRKVGTGYLRVDEEMLVCFAARIGGGGMSG